MVKNPKLQDICFFGGRLSLDFINTVHDRTERPLRDYLYHIHDLTEWAKKRNIILAEQARELEALAWRYPAKASAFFRDAMDLREYLYQLVNKIALGEELYQQDLARLNQEVAFANKYLHLTTSAGVISELFLYPKPGYEPLVVPVIKDAHMLLLENLQDRIKACPSCGWLFLDTTKNGKRRWCSMKMCGSNVKALEWYHRHKSN